MARRKRPSMRSSESSVPTLIAPTDSPKTGDIGNIAADGGDVLPRPFEGRDLIEQARVGGSIAEVGSHSARHWHLLPATGVSARSWARWVEWLLVTAARTAQLAGGLDVLLFFRLVLICHPVGLMHPSTSLPHSLAKGWLVPQVQWRPSVCRFRSVCDPTLGVLGRHGEIIWNSCNFRLRPGPNLIQNEFD